MATSSAIFSDLNGQVQWDVANNIPMCHLSYMLDKFIPQWYIKTLYKHIYGGSLETFKYSGKSRLDPEQYANLIYAGSFGDMLIVPDRIPRAPSLSQASSDSEATDEMELKNRGYDIDLVYVRTDMIADYENSEAQAPFIIDTSCTKPAYFRLRKANSGIFLRTEYLTETLSGKMDSLGLGYSRTGPALTEQLSAWEMDHVSTGICISWPHEAQEWRTRKCASNWPTAETRERIASKGCHFVAKPHRLSEDPALEFRFSLVVATKEIIDQITPRQRQCYIIFKTLIKYVVKRMKFSTYCLKTVFLWALEKIPSEQWQDPINGLATCFLCLVDDLLHALIEGNVPQYFMLECNLIEHVPKEELKENIQQLRSFRSNVLDTVLQYDELYAVKGLLHFPLSDVFKSLVIEARIPNQTLRDCLEIHIGLNIRYFKECLNGHMLYGALSIIDEIQQLGLLIDPTAKSQSQTEFMEEYASSDQLKAEFGERKSGAIMGLLVSLCSMLYRNQLKNHQTVADEQSIRNKFTTALSHKQLYASNFVYYGFFLITGGHKDEAINVLKDALQVDKSKDMVLMEFFYIMRDHLDTILSHLLYTRAYLAVPAHILAYYLLIQLYIERSNLTEAEALLDDFAKDCDSCFVNFGIVHCHLLLAWSAMCLGRYWQAADAFGKDRTLPKASNKDNFVKMWICRAMALYYLLNNTV